MEDFLLFVVLVVLLIRWWVLSQRYAEMERRIAAVSREQVDPGVIAQLVRRIYQLETTVAGLKDVRTEPARETPVEEPAPEPPQPVAAPTEPPAPILSEPATVFSALASVPAAEDAGSGSTTGQANRLPHQPRTSEDWEALVGGNLLNKLGILVLVIAIALFLGYSFTQLGPGGRSAIGFAVSLALLVGGVALERHAPYVVFARGLLAGGWAGLYFTTYAMQAVDAAKVIYNPLLGGFLLLAVAAGMVVHSLRYRVQALTGLAYFIAFTTLAITPVTALSVIALVPLAASLLVVAYRFSWSGLVLFGLLATYGTCASRGDNGAPLWSAQTVFAAYWLLFEAYDILRARRRSILGAEQPILALNAIGFGVLSYAKWSAAAPTQIHVLAAGLAAAYLASTILRAVLRPPSSFQAEETTIDRILSGAYEGPITLAAAFSAAAAALKLHGQTVNVVLLAEGELLFLAGLVFRQDYPRRLAGALFGALGLKLLSTDMPDAGTVQAAGRTLQDWTPSAALAALLFYINRGLRKSGLSYGYAASALLALVVGHEVSLPHLGLAWLGFGALLFLFGWQFRLFDFRMQGYLAGVLAIGAVWLHQIQITAGTAAPLVYPWIPLAVVALVAYIAALCALRSAADRFSATERWAFQSIASAAASAASAALLWRTVPAIYLGPAWIALGILALELGLRRWPSDLRGHAHVLAALGAGRVLFFTVLPFHTISQTDERLAIAWTALLAYAFAARMFAAKPEEAPSDESRTAVNVASACGSLFALIELWALLDRMAVAPAWALFSLVLLVAGRFLEMPDLRFQSYGLAALAFGRALFLELYSPEIFATTAERIAAGALVAGCLFVGQLFIPRTQQKPGAESYGRLFYSLIATVLTTGLFYHEVSGSMLTVAWGIEGAVLLAAGFPLRDRTLRLSGLALFLVCIGKLFFYDLRQLETLYRILSFFVLGVILVSVSWLYTRFRDHIQRYL